MHACVCPVKQRVEQRLEQISRPQGVRLHTAHVLCMDAILNVGLEMGSHNHDCWPHVFRYTQTGQLNVLVKLKFTIYNIILPLQTLENQEIRLYFQETVFLNPTVNLESVKTKNSGETVLIHYVYIY